MSLISLASVSFDQSHFDRFTRYVAREIWGVEVELGSGFVEFDRVFMREGFHP